MMRRTAAAWFALAGCTLAASCTRPASAPEMEAVETLIQQNMAMASELRGQDTTALRHMATLFATEQPAIELRFRDTLRPREAEVLGNYHRAMAGRLPELLAQRALQRAQLDSAAIRLRNLRHDMEQGLLARGRREEALRIETQWSNILRARMDTLNARSQALVEERRTYRAAIDSLLHP